jgi:ATP-dependent protease Clp ATPase subunit
VFLKTTVVNLLKLLSIAVYKEYNRFKSNQSTSDASTKQENLSIVIAGI